MTTYTRKAFLAFGWITAGVVVSSALGYLLRLLLARTLSVPAYGLVYAVLAFFGLLTVFQHLGMGEALVKRVVSESVHARWGAVKEALAIAAVVLFSTSVALGAISFFLADWLAAVYFHDPAAAQLVRIFSVALVFSPVSVLLPALFQGRQRMELISGFNVFQSVVLLAVTFLLLERGAAALLYAHLILYAALLLLLPLLLRLAFSGLLTARTTYSLQTGKAMLAYGLPVMLTGLAGVVLTYTDTALLTLLSTLEEVGLYQVALPTANTLIFLGGVVSIVLFPLAAELWERGERALMAQALRELYAYVFLLSLPLAIGLLAYPDIVLNLLFGHEYVGGAPILQALALAVVVLLLNAINASTLSGIGKPQGNTKAVAAGAIINLVGNLILIPRYGGVGAALSTLGAALVIFAVSVVLVRREIPFSIPVGTWVRGLLAGGAFLAILQASRLLDGNQYLKAALVLLLGGVAYVALLLLLRAISLREIRGLWNRILVR